MKEEIEKKEEEEEEKKEEEEEGIRIMIHMLYNVG
jgi:hypothetical protein